MAWFASPEDAANYMIFNVASDMFNRGVRSTNITKEDNLIVDYCVDDFSLWQIPLSPPPPPTNVDEP